MKLAVDAKQSTAAAERIAGVRRIGRDAKVLVCAPLHTNYVTNATSIIRIF
jgi:hypothetical protein